VTFPQATFLGISFQLVIGMVPPLIITNVGPDPELAGLIGQTDSALVEWEVEQVWGSTPSTATIRIWNLDPIQRPLLAIAAATQPVPIICSLSLGWEGSLGSVFTGQVWRVQPTMRERTDVITLLELGEGYQAIRDTPPAGGGITAGSADLVVLLLLGIMKITPSAAAQALIQQRAALLPVKAFAYESTEDPERDLNHLMATLGLNWTVTGDNEFVVYRDGLRDDVLPVKLGPNSGLLTWDVVDDGTVELEALSQPVVPGGQIFVQDDIGRPVGGGPLRIESVFHRGSSETTSTMSIVARKLQVTQGASFDPTSLIVTDVITGAG
jgi:hypothetical protein